MTEEEVMEAYRNLRLDERIKRNAIIEECVRRVMSWTTHRGYNVDVAAELVAAIRALKSDASG